MKKKMRRMKLLGLRNVINGIKFFIVREVIAYFEWINGKGYRLTEWSNDEQWSIVLNKKCYVCETERNSKLMKRCKLVDLVFLWDTLEFSIKESFDVCLKVVLFRRTKKAYLCYAEEKSFKVFNIGRLYIMSSKFT